MGKEKDIKTIVKEMRKHVGEKATVSYKDPLKVLVATVLSQRTKDANTAKAAEQLFSEFENAREIAAAPVQKLEKLIKPAGFYRQKALAIKEICTLLERNFRGTVPRDKETLLGLPLVGPKTAACVMVYGFNEFDLPADVHVHRISNRIGLVKTKTPEETEIELKKVVPRKYWREINHLMVRFGQQVCLPRNPKHKECGLQEICDFYRGKGKWK